MNIYKYLESELETKVSNSGLWPNDGSLPEKTESIVIRFFD